MSDPTAVCFFSVNAYSLFDARFGITHGGAETQMYFYALELAKDKKFRVDFVVADVGQPKCGEFSNIRVHSSYKLKAENWVQKIGRTVCLFRTLWASKPDVVLSRGAGVESGLISVFCLLFRKKYFLMISHDSECISRFTDVPGGRGIRGWSFQFAVRTASAVFSQTQYQQQLLRTRKRRASEVIRNGWPKLHPGQFKKRSERDIDVLWIARLEAFKNPEALIRIVQVCSDLKFTVVGSIGNDQGYGEEIVSKLNSLPNLEYLSAMRIDQIDDLCSRALVFLNTSFAEGYPNTLIQAMRSGTPLVSLHINPDQIFHPGLTGLYGFAQEKLCVDVIRWLINDANAWSWFSHRSFDQWDRDHRLEETSEKLKNLIVEYTGGSS